MSSGDQFCPCEVCGRLGHWPSYHVNDGANAVMAFATAILHGDEEHRKWLMEAAEAFNNGEPLPPSRHNSGIDK